MSARTPGAMSGFAAWMDAVRHDKRAAVGAGIIVFFVLLAVFGPLFVGDPNDLVGIPLQGPSAEHWLGTTGQGQDVLAQLVVGTRMSLLIGFTVGLTVVFVGALIGVTAGYAGGRVDAALSLLFNVFLVIPGLPLAIVIAAYLPSGPFTIGFVLVVAGWAWNARVLRAQTLALRNRDFVGAAVVAGESSFRIVTSEILPNMTSLIVSQVIGGTVYAIGAQVGLEFLGLGDVSAVTWGTNLYWAQNDSALLTGAWWTFETRARMALVSRSEKPEAGSFDPGGHHGGRACLSICWTSAISPWTTSPIPGRCERSITWTWQWNAARSSASRASRGAGRPRWPRH
jgi:peptide/nickel transport system permease protein